MKTSISVLAALFITVGAAYAAGDGPPDGTANTTINVGNQVDTDQSQTVSVIGGGDSSSSAQGGDASSDSIAASSINSTSISNYRTRTPPVSVFPPYLPYWNHGGWGIMNAYFPNGPNSDDQAYERIFNPDNSRDMKELKGVLESLSYEGPLEAIGGILNGVGVVFGGPDNFHHGRGFEISSSLIRDRRPRGKPLLVFIDSNVDTALLDRAGYAYVGKISLEGNVDRNWDHVYEVAVAEALPWNVDILLISGGMKGVTVGSNLSFPGAGGAYSQANYSVSLFGSVSSGITEGKGKAIVSAQGYRYWPRAVKRRMIPQTFYEKVRAKLMPTLGPQLEQRQTTLEQETALSSSQEPEILKQETADTPQQRPQYRQPEVAQAENVPYQRKTPFRGIEISRELYNMAGFTEQDKVAYLTVK